ncbi:hypothetical protein [Corynebacterium terpenotabidum]|nr:hypothetical protein [Corynebacterium terpenotabidum]
MSTGTITGTRRSGSTVRSPYRQEGTRTGARRSGAADRRGIVPPRTGSLQQVSVRGRRVAVKEKVNSTFLRLVVVLVLLVGAGVTAAMFLSAKTTEQAFELQEARSRSTTLANELESLNRDYRELSSSEHLASEASRLGMVVPGQTGVLAVDGDQINEIRGADGSTNGEIVDLDATGQSVSRTSRPSTDQTQNATVPGTSTTESETDSAASTDGEGQSTGEQSAQGEASAAEESSAVGTGQLPY